SATITITVHDSDGGLTSASFGLEVDPVNDAPSLSTVSDQTMLQDTSISVPFVVLDPESDPDDLTLFAFSSSPSLVANANLVLSGSGQNRSLSITPGHRRFRAAPIRLVAGDPDGEPT